MSCFKCGKAFTPEEIELGLLVALRLKGVVYRLHIECSQLIVLQWLDQKVRLG